MPCPIKILVHLYVRTTVILMGYSFHYGGVVSFNVWAFTPSIGVICGPEYLIAAWAMLPGLFAFCPFIFLFSPYMFQHGSFYSEAVMNHDILYVRTIDCINVILLRCKEASQ
jgi:hypothetical protein